MPSIPDDLLSYLRVVLGAWRNDPREDDELLARFAQYSDGEAFKVLVWRYGLLVWRSCTRVLREGPDAEDAFQTAFLALARKAGRLPIKNLAGWLHQVARQAALKSEAGVRRRRSLEQLLRAKTQPAAEGSAGRTELYAALDEELGSLPERLRVPLLLHYIEGRSQVEVARLLGCARSALQKRLTRGEAMLRKRLEKRGLAVAIGSVAVLLGNPGGAPTVPACLIDSTARAALRSLSFPLESSTSAALAEGVMKTMLATKVKIVTVLLGATLCLAGGGVLAYKTLAGNAAELPQPAGETRGEAEASRQPGAAARVDCYGDPLPEGALARLGTTRLRHKDHSEHVLFAPGGKVVASGGLDNTVRLWDMATGKLVHSLKHPLGWPRPGSFARDGKTLVSVAGNRLWLWDVRTGEQLRELKLEPNQHVQAISSDAKMAASWEDGAVIRLWDVATGNPLRVLQGHGKSIRWLSFSPDNKTLASACADDKGVWLWDVSSGKLLHKLEHPQLVWAVSFAPGGKTLASGGGDTSIQHPFKPKGNPNAIRLWDVASGKLLRTLEGHQQIIASLSFSPNGKIVASWSWDRTIRLWDVTTCKELRKLKCQCAASLSFSPDGKVLASGGNGPAVHLWDVTTGEQLHCPGETHKGGIRSISFSPDGRTLATGTRWGEEKDTLRLWDATSGKPLRSLEHSGGTHSVVFAPDGKTLASGGVDVVCLWDATTGKLRRKLEAPGGSPLAFSLDGKVLAAGSDNGDGLAANGGILRLWDVSSGTQLHALKHPKRTLSVAFSPDRKTIAVGTLGSTLHLWDAITGKELQRSKEDWGEIAALSFSPDGRMLAVGSKDKIHLVEVLSYRVRHTLTGQSGLVSAVAFSPSGRLLASASDGTVRLWKVNAVLASSCHQFSGHGGGVAAVAFSPDGRRLASGSYDSTALVWDVTRAAGGQTGLGEEQPRAARLTQEELTACWQSLASMNAVRACQTMRTLAAVPEQAVPFLAEHLLLKKPDPQKVARLLAELDSEDFRVRSKAAKELEKLGEAVAPALRQALQDKPSVEVRWCIQQLLKKIDQPFKEIDQPFLKGLTLGLLRRLRTVEVLEWIDNPAARELLKKLAAAPPREEVGREAQAALKRLRALSNF